MRSTSEPDDDATAVERSRRIETELAEAAERAARRSELEGRVMRAPGGSDLLRRIGRYPMRRVKK